MISALAISPKSLLARKRAVLSIALDIGVRDVPDIGVTRIELLDLFVVDIQSDDWKALFRYGAGKRQPHVAHAADSDSGRFVDNFPRQRAVVRGVGFVVGLGSRLAVDQGIR